MHSAKVNLSVVYRTPSYIIDDSIVNFVNSLDSCNFPSVLFGDFNIPEVDWQNFSFSSNIPDRFHKFVDSLRDSGFLQFVRSPTRCGNFLDLLFCNSSDLINLCYVTDFFGDLGYFTDHKSIICTLMCDYELLPSISTPRRDFSKADWPSIVDYFAAINWNMLFSDTSCLSANDFWNVFIQQCNFAISAFVPMTSLKKRRSFISNKTKNAYGKYQRLRKRFLNSHSVIDKYFMRLAFNLYRKSRRFDYIVSESRIVSKTGSRKFWSFARSRIGKAKIDSSFKNRHNVRCNTDAAKCEALAEHFEHVYSHPTAVDSNSFNNLPVLTGSECRVVFTVDIVQKILKNCKNDYCSGPDELPNIFLRNLYLPLSFPLCTIFNVSYHTAQLPDIWLHSRVSCINKIPKPISVNDFRPISISSSCCKAMESIIVNHLMCHLQSSDFFSTSQFGFLPKRDCQLQLIKCLHDWCSSLDVSVPVDCIYLDLKKAFDSVDHEILLTKLSKLNLSVYLLNWIRSWLYNRTQFIRYNNSDSRTINVPSGVPQGSILGPLLFVIFINDLPNIVKHSQIMLFADDCKLYRKISSINDHFLLVSDLYNVSQWCKRNRLSVNLSKCAVMHFGSNNSTFDYYIDNTVLATVTCYRDLGILINNKLSFDDHIKDIIRRASIRCSVIRRSFKIKNQNLQLLMFKSFVLPLLEYASCSFNSIGFTLSEKLESVQRKFTRYILCHNDFHLSYTERLVKFNLFSLSDRRLVNDMVQMFRLVKSLVSFDMAQLNLSFNTVNRGHNYKLHMLGSNTDLMRKFFTCRSILIFNSLNSNTLKVHTVKSFRNSLLRDSSFICKLSDAGKTLCENLFN